MAYATSSSTAVTTAAEPPEDAQGALQWLQARARAFIALGPKILDLQHRAALAAGAAREAGDLETEAAAKDLIRALGKIGQAHQTTADRLVWLFDQLPGVQLSGMGALPAIPVALAGVVVAVAFSVALIFRRVTAAEQVVQLLEAGRLTAGEARALLDQVGGGGIFGGIVELVQLAAVAWVAIKLFQAWEEHRG